MKNIIKQLLNHKEPPMLYQTDDLIIIRIQKSKITAIKHDIYITIGDIQTEKTNKGHGSAMMNLLIDYAKQNQFQQIKGWISEVDIDHIDRLKHFYHKFGFTIEPNQDKNSIEKYLINLNL